MYYIIGIIANVHGIKGELKIFPETNDLRIFEVIPYVLIDEKEYKKISTRFHKNMVLLKLEEIEDRTVAERLKGKEIKIRKEDMLPLEDEEYYIFDLIGSSIFDKENKKIGKLVDILENKANDVFVVKTEDGKELLLPYIDECVLQIDVENKKIIVNIMEGLL